MSRTFGWSYPPGCSGPPGDEGVGDGICEVCGGNYEKDQKDGGCLCCFLTGREDGGVLSELSDKELSKLNFRFETVCANLFGERKRRYDKAPKACALCGKSMTFDELEREECPVHSECQEKSEKDAEAQMEKEWSRENQR